MKIFNAKNKKIKALAIISSALALVACFAFNFAPLGVSAAELCVEDLREEYFVGESFVVPSASFKLSETESIPARFTVRTPSGKYLQSERFSLDSYGTYTVTYTAKKNNDRYSKEISFNVVKPLFSLDGYGSVEYGVHEYLKNESGEAADGYEGLMVGLGEGVTLKYNRKIDLTKLTKADSLITFNVTPSTIGYWEAQTINVKLTDENDPNKFIVLVTDCYGAKSSSYAWAGLNETTTMYVGNTFYNAAAGVHNGLATDLSFCGMPSGEGVSIADNTLSFNYDYLNKQIWFKSGGKYTNLVDLGSFEDVFDGFSTGRVLLEVYTTKSRSDKFNFVIRSVADHDISEAKLYDDVAPEITVDYGKYDKNSYPSGAVNCGYPIFSASAYDLVDGDVLPEVYVYYNYYSNDKISVKIENGAFVPDKSGVYTICYVAKDKYGNEAIERIDVEVGAAEPIKLAVSAPDGSYTVGDEFVLPEATVSGGHGAVDVNASAWHGESEVAITNGKLRFLDSGTFTIKYAATDYVGQSAVKTIEITVADAQKPIFITDADSIIEKVFIVGNKYTLPEVSAIVKSASGYSEVKATVSADNGAVSGGVYEPADEGEAKITYTATSNGVSNTLVIEREVYSLKNSDGLLDLKKLFLVDSAVTSSYDSDGNAKYSATSDGSVMFANKLLSESFSVTFGFEKSGLSALELVITDAYDPSVKLNLLLTKTRGAGVLSVNGGEGHAVGGRFTVGDETIISYKNSQRKLSVNSFEFDVSELFDGFVSDYAYLSINMIGVTGGADLIIKKVCNQLLNSEIAIDMIAPVVAVVGDYGGSFERGSVYNVAKVLSCDMISGEVAEFTMSIKHSSGNYVSVDGTEIKNVSARELSFTLADYGSYSISFNSKDARGIKASFTYVVHVLDDEAPTVKLTGSYAKSGSVGSTITVANAVLSDNVDSAEDISLSVFVKSPSGVMSMIDKTFKAEQKGTYTVYYYATDAFGNLSISQYEIEIR